MSKMTVQSYIDYVEVMLGADLVEVEIQNILEKVVKQSLEELKEYLTMPTFVTVPYAPRIDMTPYKVRSIIQVYRTNAMDSVLGTTGLADPFILAAGMMQSAGSYDMTRYANLLQVRQMKNTISTDLEFRFDDPWLMVTQNPMSSSTITIEYTPIVTSVEDITSDYWIGKLRKLVLANSKLVLGRVRGKYKLNNALYDNDAQLLLQEGNVEKNEIMQFLQQNSDIILPIGS